MKTGVILDTDLGYDPDDLFALLLLLNSPELQINLVVSGDEVNGKRAAFARKILDQCECWEIRVVQGEDLGNHDFVADELLHDFSYSADTNYLEAMKQVIDSFDKVVYIGIQGFSNLAHFLKRFPESNKKLMVYQMGGSIDYSRRPGWVEHNVKIDKEAARDVLTSNIDIFLVMAQTTFNPVYMVDDQHRLYKKLKASDEQVHQLLARHVDLFHEATTFWPYMHDPLTVAVALGKDFVDFYEAAVSINELGNIYLSSGSPQVRLSRAESKDREFMKFLEERLFF